MQPKTEFRFPLSAPALRQYQEERAWSRFERILARLRAEDSRRLGMTYRALLDQDRRSGRSVPTSCFDGPTD